MDLRSAIEQRSATVAVVGLGYVGLPLAMHAAGAGFRVLGVDADADHVAAIRAGASPISDIEDHQLREGLSSGLEVGTDPAVLSDAEVILICVPTPLRDDLPDMSYVETAARQIAETLRPGQLIILESTTYPGTTEELLFSILEGVSGLKAGIDFFLGFSPERIDPGNPTYGLSNVPKIVGGIDATSTELMVSFYSAFVDEVVTVSSPRAAEMTKLLENTFRHVNIALVNEIAILCHDLGIDVWEVIDAASTKPFGFQPFYPGPGWGGHCIPVDPSYLSWRVRQLGETARFVELAREMNKKMPAYVVQRVSEALNENGKSLKGARVLVLGVAYKPDIADLRESPALTIIERLLKSGADVQYHDPFIPEVQTRRDTLRTVELRADEVQAADIVVVHTDHSVYDWQWLASHARTILDTRNALKSVASDRVIRL